MVTIVVPAFNEERYLQDSVVNVIKAAKNAGNVKLDIIIVDDASWDNTSLIINKLKKKYSFVRSIKHNVNCGLGFGVREAIREARFGKFMIIPGDNDASVELLESLLKNRNKAEMVLSYYLNKELRGRTRNFLSTLYGLIYMTTFNVYIQYFNGAGIYPTRKLRELTLGSNRFAITAEINTKLLCRGCTLYELPGYQQTGLEGSSSMALKNFIEVFTTYARLVWEIKFIRRNFYRAKPIRMR